MNRVNNNTILIDQPDIVMSMKVDATKFDDHVRDVRMIWDMNFYDWLHVQLLLISNH